MTPYEDKINELKGQTLEDQLAFFQKSQLEIIELNKLLEEKKTLYKTIMKDLFGLCDGEQFNIFQLIELVKKIAKSK